MKTPKLFPEIKFSQYSIVWLGRREGYQPWMYQLWIMIYQLAKAENFKRDHRDLNRMTFRLVSRVMNLPNVSDIKAVVDSYASSCV